MIAKKPGRRAAVRDVVLDLVFDTLDLLLWWR